MSLPLRDFWQGDQQRGRVVSILGWICFSFVCTCKYLILDIRRILVAGTWWTMECKTSTTFSPTASRSPSSSAAPRKQPPQTFRSQFSPSIESLFAICSEKKSSEKPRLGCLCVPPKENWEVWYKCVFLTGWVGKQPGAPSGLVGIRARRREGESGRPGWGGSGWGGHQGDHTKVLEVFYVVNILPGWWLKHVSFQ